MNSLLTDDSTPRLRVLTLNRPERLNALDGPTLALLIDAVRGCSSSEQDIRVIVIRGTGRGFCSGSDLKWLADGVLDDVAAHMCHQDRMQEAFELLETCQQIVIACVNGLALAGGFELALSCDIVIVDEAIEMGDEHIRKNLLPSGGSSQRLPRKVGLPRAMYYLLTGRRMSGREAAQMGLASAAFPATELVSRTMQLAEEIARADPHALAAMKQMVRRGLELPLKEGLWMERWLQYRYRNESKSLVSAVYDFATQPKGQVNKS